MEHVLLLTEVNTGHQCLVHLLLEFVLQLLCGFHAVFSCAQDAADAALFILCEFGHILPLLQDGLDKPRG